MYDDDQKDVEYSKKQDAFEIFFVKISCTISDSLIQE